MPAEGFLGKHTLSGERAATDDHPVVLRHLPLSGTASASEIAIGTVMKRVDVTETEGEGDSAVTKVVDVAWEPLLSTDAATIMPVAVVDDVYDPDTDESQSALCVLHGGVKMRLLRTGDGKELTASQVAQLFETGIYPV